MQLNAYLSRAGICSRRKAVELIKQGSVKVNGVVVTKPGFRVSDKDRVDMQGRRVVFQEPIYIVVNKPKGYLTTVTDPRGRPTVMDLIRTATKQRVYPVGRLDQATTGLLLLTNDGGLAQQLSHPKYEVPKEYHVVLNKPFDVRDILKLKTGIRLHDGIVIVDKIMVVAGTNGHELRIQLHSGKYRVIRRLLEHIGYRVTMLDRIAYAGLVKRGLRIGGWRFLTGREIKMLKLYAVE